eukprot:PhF_6_TR4492/c2_g1_i4/m.6204
MWNQMRDTIGSPLGTGQLLSNVIQPPLLQHQSLGVGGTTSFQQQQPPTSLGGGGMTSPFAAKKALFIGVSQFEDPSIPAVTYAPQDCNLFSQCLHHFGFQTTHLLNDNYRLTRTHILKTLESQNTDGTVGDSGGGLVLQVIYIVSHAALTADGGVKVVLYDYRDTEDNVGCVTLQELCTVGMTPSQRRIVIVDGVHKGTRDLFRWPEHVIPVVLNVPGVVTILRKPQTSGSSLTLKLMHAIEELGNRQSQVTCKTLVDAVERDQASMIPPHGATGSLTIAQPAQCSSLSEAPVSFTCKVSFPMSKSVCADITTA